jgi:hypothetical protein
MIECWDSVPLQYRPKGDIRLSKGWYRYLDLLINRIEWGCVNWITAAMATIASTF